jgi:crotonobetainyl-CoA:carnitine CoA-transferase CaiB-like acyl-CoA transferase
VPAAGQHTSQVLAELGYSEPDIAALLADRVAEAEPGQ